MHIQMVGIDYTMADVDIRSLFSFTKKESRQALTRWAKLSGIRGVVLISTCNRTELWASTGQTYDPAEKEEHTVCSGRVQERPVSGESAFPAPETILLFDLLCESKNLDPAGYRKFAVEREDREAVHHLFSLTSGLKSQILAEDQIITQVNDALSLSRENQTTDSVLEVLFRRAVTAAKRVKTEISFSRADQTAMDAAIRMLCGQGFVLNGARCLVVGNGVMGKLAAQSLCAAGADVTVTVRQYKSGEVQIPAGCARINYGDRAEFLPQCDLVVSATASPNVPFTEALVKQALERKSADGSSQTEKDHDICRYTGETISEGEMIPEGETIPTAETKPEGETIPAAETMPGAKTMPAAETIPEEGTGEWIPTGEDRRKDRIFIDLAVPRDIEPSVSDLNGVTLYTIDDFRTGQIPEQMKVSYDAAEVILEEEMQEFYAWLTGRDIAPRVRSLSKKAADDFHFRVQKELGTLPLSGAERKKLSDAMDSAAGKVIAKVLFELKNSMNIDDFQRCLDHLEMNFPEDT